MDNKNFTSKATSSEYLQKRININKNSTNNFEHWSINTMPKVQFNSNILDLGCGTGKQIESFTPFLRASSSYYACDISKDSIDLVRNNYKQKPQLTLYNDSFDNMNLFLNKDTKFDLIYSFYALYYTQNLKNLIHNIYDSLSEGGVFWVVMPYKNTNVEIFNILEKLYKIDEKVYYSINGFSDDVISISSELGFKDIDINLFENKINFDSKNELLEYIKNTTFYNSDFAKEVSQELDKNFNDDFYLTKEVISIKLVK